MSDRRNIFKLLGMQLVYTRSFKRIYIQINQTVERFLKKRFFNLKKAVWLILH